MVALAPLLAVALALPASTGPTSLHKVAVLVGANAAAQGRVRLQYAHRDAAQLSAVLQLTGGLAAEDITLLEDPPPDEVLRALDARLAEIAARGEESLLLFYYSGHADETNLYPGGQPLALTALKTRLDDPRAAVRIGILDACRGGAWTRAKGLTAQPPFDFTAPVLLGAEGSALIASSAGSESAHESDVLQGSFFTHHFVAGLRGAADVSRDGMVSIQEAFEHARKLTVRDTALHAPEPQHPSFDMQLHGRAEVQLASLSAAASTLALHERQGPLQVIQLSTGLVVVDLEPGARQVTVAVAPGRYLVRRRLDAETAAREVDVSAGSSVAVDEAQLALVGSERLASKSMARIPAVMTSLPAGNGEVRLWLGVQHDSGAGGLQLAGSDFAFAAHLAYGFTDRLQLNLLTLTYRLGEPTTREWLPWGGITGLFGGYSSIEGGVFGMSLGAGLDLRQPLGPGHLVAGFSTASSGRWSRLQSSPLDTWRVSLDAGFVLTLFDTVSFSLGLAWSQHVLSEGTFATWNAQGLQPVLSVGSVVSLAGRSRPLLQVHLTPTFSLDAHVRVGFNFATGRVNDAYLAGFTWNWGS